MSDKEQFTVQVRIAKDGQTAALADPFSGLDIDLVTNSQDVESLRCSAGPRHEFEISVKLRDCCHGQPDLVDNTGAWNTDYDWWPAH